MTIMDFSSSPFFAGLEAETRTQTPRIDVEDSSYWPLEYMTLSWSSMPVLSRVFPLFDRRFALLGPVYAGAATVEGLGAGRAFGYGSETEH